MSTTPRLSRPAVVGDTTAPIPRIVHLGLGAFHRAHQAWYTARAADSAEWSIAAFTGRSPKAADELEAQDGLYTLIERSAQGDAAEIMSVIVEAQSGSNVKRLDALLSAPATAVVTLTVTETAYRLRHDGELDPTDPIIAADIEALREGCDPESVLGRLVAGLAARRTAGAPGLAIVPCDNIPDNGPFVRRGVLELAGRVDADLERWIDAQISFVSTSVDRITPRTTDDDRATAQDLTGWADASPVVTEPFADWVLSGAFPNGRPQWETAGARFVDDIEPYERRKLWLLNGAHSLLACAGLLRGHTTVAEAMGDPECRAWVRELWDEAVQHLPSGLDLDDYRQALEDRFDNARIAHHLAQIAMESSTKLGVRVAPVLRAERAAGRDGAACIRAIAAWVSLQLAAIGVQDARRRALDEARASADAVRALVAVIDPQLASDDEVVVAVAAAAAELAPAAADA